MNVGEAARKRTGDLVDDAVHAAGLADEDTHVRGNALAKSGAQLHKERNDQAHAGLHVVGQLTADGLLEGLALGAESYHVGWLEGAAEGLAILVFAYEALGALSEAEEKAYAIGKAFTNDAVNVAIAGNLAFDPAFAALEQAARPGVTAGTGKLTAVLQDPNNPTKMVLQARADEGYLAAERAMKATANVPKEQRAQALLQWFKDNGYGERLSSDVAFTKGVEYHAFVQAAAAEHKYGIDPAKELAKVETRVPVERPLMVRP
ncbi:MAG: hypothetical protein KIT84_30530 [Labilithrix sp.]|nr:hypothetical protein [Labilithrix sp.]MCW5815403.1 hypothetical protein [Labilithrix sp.]